MIGVLQCIFFNAIPFPITFILYSLSSNKISQSVNINSFLIIQAYLNIIRPFIQLTIIFVKPDFVEIIVR